jgi:hypothetical protein
MARGSIHRYLVAGDVAPFPGYWARVALITSPCIPYFDPPLSHYFATPNIRVHVAVAASLVLNDTRCPLARAYSQMSHWLLGQRAGSQLVSMTWAHAGR